MADELDAVRRRQTIRAVSDAVRSAPRRSLAELVLPRGRVPRSKVLHVVEVVHEDSDRRVFACCWERHVGRLCDIEAPAGACSRVRFGGSARESEGWRPYRSAFVLDWSDHPTIMARAEEAVRLHEHGGHLPMRDPIGCEIRKQGDRSLEIAVFVEEVEHELLAARAWRAFPTISVCGPSGEPLAGVIVELRHTTPERRRVRLDSRGCATVELKPGLWRASWPGQLVPPPWIHRAGAYRLGPPSAGFEVAGEGAMDDGSLLDLRPLWDRYRSGVDPRSLAEMIAAACPNLKATAPRAARERRRWLARIAAALGPGRVAPRALAEFVVAAALGVSEAAPRMSRLRKQ